MRRAASQVARGVALLALSVAASAADATGTRQQLIDRYCIDCHDTTEWAGGLALDTVDVGSVAGDAELWEKVVRKVRTGMMPPPGEPRPPRTSLQGFAANLEHDLDRAAVGSAPAASASVRRLSRTQYANAVRDLLDLDVDVSTLLPADDVNHGFDNGESLGSSPALIEGYVAAAARVSRRAVGDPTTPAAQIEYRAPAGAAQARHVEGLPLGTRGGLTVRHDFPLDATYEIRVTAGGFAVFGSGEEPRLPSVQLLVDGVPQALQQGRARLKLSAGPHQLAAAIVDDLRNAGVDEIYGVYATRGGVQSIVVMGPHDPTGVGDTPSRRRIFSCRPTSADDEPRCARDIVTKFTARAFRVPQVDDAAVERVMAFYARGRAAGDFESGIQNALARVLVDPQFLFRFERRKVSGHPRPDSPVMDVTMASRLSFFLWSSIPDETLLADAARGLLSTPRGLERELRRMVADPRASALVDQFGAQWLQLKALDEADPDVRGFDDNLRQSLQRETRMLLSSVFLEDRSVLTLLDAGYTFLDERLAQHYGVSGVRDSYMRKVPLKPNDPRRGVLGQGSVLTLTSVANRTSPVSRGVWVMENLMGAVPPQPPANVDTNLDGENFETPSGPMPVRQRLEMHRRNPACASCHQIMDPLGLALENFDLVGRWRTQESGTPIDASGKLVDGTSIHGPETLRAALLQDPERFVTTLTEKLMSFALGRALDHHDMPAVRAIVRNAARDDFRFSALLLGVVGSPQFQAIR